MRLCCQIQKCSKRHLSASPTQYTERSSRQPSFCVREWRQRRANCATTAVRNSAPLKFPNGSTWWRTFHVRQRVPLIGVRLPCDLSLAIHILPALDARKVESSDLLAAGIKMKAQVHMRIHYPIFYLSIKECRDLDTNAVAMITEPQ